MVDDPIELVDHQRTSERRIDHLGAAPGQQNQKPWGTVLRVDGCPPEGPSHPPSARCLKLGFSPPRKPGIFLLGTLLAFAHSPVSTGTTSKSSDDQGPVAVLGGGDQLQ